MKIVGIDEGSKDGDCTVYGRLEHGVFTVEKIKWTTKCMVYGCSNHKGEGLFVGDMCSPCFNMISQGVVTMHGETFIHGLYRQMDESYQNGYLAALNQIETTIAEARQR